MTVPYRVGGTPGPNGAEYSQVRRSGEEPICVCKRSGDADDIAELLNSKDNVTQELLDAEKKIKGLEEQIKQFENMFK